MKCPACGNDLTPKTVGDLTVDTCQGGCGGIWFDQLELKKVDEQQEAAGEALLDIPRDPSIQLDARAKHRCPKCQDIVMMRHFFSVKRHVAVDECGQCGGVWLDVGELAAIRNLFDSEEARKAAAEEYFHDLFGAQLAERIAKAKAVKQKIARVAQIFRYLCPSYYIPGDQAWGAF